MTAMTPEQKTRLRHASLCAKPISATTTEKRWLKSRKDVYRALQGRNLQAGLTGAVFIESCQAMDRWLVRSPVAEAA